MLQVFVTFFTLCFLTPPSLFPLVLPLRPLLRVHALVPPQVAQGTAGVVALVAAVRLLTSVGAGVALQVDELRRGVGAHGAAVWFLAVVGPHVAFQVVGVARGEGAQRAWVEFGGEVARPAFLRCISPLPVGAAADGSVGWAWVPLLRGVHGGFMVEALLTGQTIKLRPQVQSHTCSTFYVREGCKAGRRQI